MTGLEHHASPKDTNQGHHGLGMSCSPPAIDLVILTSNLHKSGVPKVPHLIMALASMAPFLHESLFVN